MFGAWGSGEPTKNIPTDRVLEDPFFRVSDQSLFIQLVDFCAYALLRREKPTPRTLKYGLQTAFNELASRLVLEASTKDPEGIIRP